jgi:hypothetical protein
VEVDARFRSDRHSYRPPIGRVAGSQHQHQTSRVVVARHQNRDEHLAGLIGPLLDVEPPVRRIEPRSGNVFKLRDKHGARRKRPYADGSIPTGCGVRLGLNPDDYESTSRVCHPGNVLRELRLLSARSQMDSGLELQFTRFEDTNQG